MQRLLASARRDPRKLAQWFISPSGRRKEGFVMLVISRCVDAGIRIGDSVKLKVLRIGQKRVTIGVEAPPDVRVSREEVADEPGGTEREPAASLDLKVLVVEDTPVHGLLIERSLTSRGVKNVVRTSTGEDAMHLLSLAQQNAALRPDLILLDLHLPGISGLQVLSAIKSAPSLSSIPVVVLSCSDSDEDVARCMASGANAFLCKSTDYEQFRKSVFRLTDFWSQVRRAS
jgi:carbon storage regulator CsrA